MSRPFRKAITLIEVLIVVAIIGVLLMLLIPALQAAREASRRTQCVNNLRQFALALNNYESNYKVFPSGWNGFSIHVNSLPYLEENTLYNTINLSVLPTPSLYVENLTVNKSLVKVLVCPSDYMSSGLAPTGVSAFTSYPGCVGDFIRVLEGSKYVYKPKGIFANATSISNSAIRDGLSVTLLASEFAVGGTPSFDKLRSIFMPDDFSSGSAQTFAEFTTRCQTLDHESPVKDLYKGSNWIIGLYDYTLFDTTFGPNQPSCRNTLKSVEINGTIPSSSYHINKVNAVFVDGHVKSISDSIDVAIWRSLGTRSGGEVVSAESY
jgi:prepilin-type processing-associated H-X9-DG protein